MTQTNYGSSLLLKGVVGSQAFGLANVNSDFDYQGVFVVPTEQFLGLETRFQESVSFKNPDTTYHEVGKFCRLALGCNPTVLDLLWLDQYNVRTELGTELINLRNNCLSAPRIRGAYFGYASDQLGKLLKDPRAEKRAKNARHFARLLHQGYQLYSTGTYSVRLEDPEWYLDFGTQVGYGLNVSAANDLLSNYEDAFNSGVSVLPETPNKEPINNWLLKVRNEFYQYSNPGFAEDMEEFKEWPRQS
jgi:uncharacterized protein